MELLFTALLLKYASCCCYLVPSKNEATNKFTYFLLPFSLSTQNKLFVVYIPYPDYSLPSLYSSPLVQTSPPTWTQQLYVFHSKTKTKKLPRDNNEVKKNNIVRQNINQPTAFGKHKKQKKKREREENEPKKRHRKYTPICWHTQKSPKNTKLEALIHNQRTGKVKKEREKKREYG